MKIQLRLFSYLLLLPVIMSSTYSCKTPDDQKNYTYFGGKIKNPFDRKVLILKNEKVIDSVKLDDVNRFMFRFDSLKEGLYTFKHGPEFQYVYLQPKDSVLLYLNTWDFDESLVYSGRGAEKNNFLIDLFLDHEKIERRFRRFYHLDENEFEAKIKYELAPLEKKYKLLQDLNDFQPSTKFDKVAKIAIYYPFYSKKEYYPLRHRDSRNMPDFPKVRKSFYNYRSKTDLNDESLMDFRTYTYYIESFLYNQAFEKGRNDPANRNFSFDFLEAVNENITNPVIRNKYLISGFWGSLKENLTESKFKQVEEYFFRNCDDERYVAEAKKALEKFNKIKKGDPLPQFTTIDLKGNQTNLNNLIHNSPTVIFFWPRDPAKKEIAYRRLKLYQKKYPNVALIGIERGSDVNSWKKFVRKKHLKRKFQLRIDQNCSKYSWFEGELSRTMILDKNGKIYNPFLFFEDVYNIDRNLQQLIKQ